MAEETGRDTETDAGNDPAASGDSEEESEKKAKRKVNMTALAICGAMAVAVGLAVFGSFYFIKGERQREVQAWQVRLGIVADSRSSAVNEWVDQNFGHMRELAENASLQLYMSELALTEEKPEPSDEKGKTEEVETGAEEEAPSAGYLRNLLVATAERTGFKAPPPVGEVGANVERVGVAGIALVDKEGKSLVSTPDMPPMNARARAAVIKALEGEPAVIDIYLGASGLPTMGFVLPIFGIQDDSDGAKGIGGVIGIRTIGQDLFQRLNQP
ncbi:MAG: cache domain-containing protein, partial [Proteobacteria bacterium]|nr:cache domain-containing protein [Pseudomonadota bacterium]